MTRSGRSHQSVVDSVMFYWTYRWSVMFIAMVLLIGCHKDKQSELSPEVSLVNEPGYIAGEALITPGTTVSFMVDMSQGSEKITNFYIEVAIGESEPKRYFDTAMYVEQFTWTGSFYKSQEPEETWSFVVRDRLGGEDRVELTLLADTGSVYTPVTYLDNIVMGAQNNSQTGSFYSFINDTVYSAEAAKVDQQLIDLVFYYGEDDLTVASPGANIEEGIFPAGLSPVDWEIRNTTRYIKTSLGNEDFINVTNDSILIALYIDADGKRKAKNLAAGDVYVFRSQSGRLGLFLVNSVSGTTGGLLEMDIKIQSSKK